LQSNESFYYSELLVALADAVNEPESIFLPYSTMFSNGANGVVAYVLIASTTPDGKLAGDIAASIVKQAADQNSPLRQSNFGSYIVGASTLCSDGSSGCAGGVTVPVSPAGSGSSSSNTGAIVGGVIGGVGGAVLICGGLWIASRKKKPDQDTREPVTERVELQTMGAGSRDGPEEGAHGPATPPRYVVHK